MDASTLRHAWLSVKKWVGTIYNRLSRVSLGREYKIAYALMFGLLILGLTVLYFQRPFNSDDVAIQTIFHQHIASAGSHTAWLGEDNWIIKVPYYLLIDILFGNSMLIVFTSTVIFNVAGLTMFLYACWYFMRRFGISDGHGHRARLLPVIWLLSLSSTLGYWFLYNPNQRNIEIGICFLALVGFAKYTDGDFKFENLKAKLAAISLALLLGLFLYNDPYFVAMLFGPVLLLAALDSIYKKSRRSFYLLGFLAASFAITLILRFVASIFNINNRHVELHFIPFSAFWPNVNLAIEGIMSIFGADFWDKSIMSLGVVRSLLNLGLVAVLIGTIILLLRGKQWKKHDKWLTFWLLQPLLILSIFIFSSNTSLNGYFSIRFLALLPFYAPVLLGLAYTRILNKPKWKQWFIKAIVAATVLNSAFMISQLLHRPEVRPNTENKNIVALLKHRGLEKGAAQYWNGHIHSYLSDYSITIVPTNCLHIQHFLMDDHTITKPTKKSFYLYDTRYPQQCDEKQVHEVLGQPTETIIVDGSKKLFIYDYDVTKRLQ